MKFKIILLQCVLILFLLLFPVKAMDIVLETTIKAIEFLAPHAREISMVGMAATYHFFNKSKQPEQYEISYKPFENTPQPTTASQQRVEYTAGNSYDQLDCRPGSALKNRIVEKLTADQKIIPVTGKFDWKKALEESSEKQQNYAQLNPEAIFEEINKPIFSIAQAPNIAISSNYFEQFKTPSITDSINYSLSINGQQVQQTFNPKNKLFFKANVVTEQPVHYQQATIQEFQQEMAQIEYQRHLKESFNRESEQLKKIFGNLHSKNQFLIAKSLDELCNKNNFKTMRSVNYFNRQLDQFKKKMQHNFLMDDGSLRGGWPVGCEKDITHSFAHFFIYPGANTLDDLLDVTQHFQKNNIPGAQAASNHIRNELNKGIGQTLADNFSAAIDFIDGTSRRPNLSTKYQENPLNKDIKQMLALCDQNKWQEAQVIACTYEQAYLRNTNDQSVRNAFYATKNVLKDRAHHPGTYNRYGSDPYFAQILKTDKENLCNHLPILEKRLEIKDYILKMIDVKRPTVPENRLSYELVPHFFDPKAIAECLSFTSQDHPDPQIRQLYHTFHDKNGIAKVLHYDKSKLQGLKVPVSIGDAKNIEARKSLNMLVKVETPTQEAKNEVKQGIKYAISSCSESILKDSFQILGGSVTKAVVVPQADKTILLCDDFTTLNKTRDQQELQSAIVPMSAKTVDALQNQKQITFDFNLNLKMTLHGMSKMSSLSKDNKSDLAKALYNQAIDAMLDNISKQDASFKPFQKYLQTVCEYKQELLHNKFDNNNPETKINNATTSLMPDPDDDPKKKKEKKFSEKDALEIWDKSKELTQLRKQIDELSKKLSNERPKSRSKKDDLGSQRIKLDELAEKIYEQFRNNNFDVQKISKNTGISEQIIKQIKDHLYNNEHLLDEGVKKFDPEIDIVDSWQRLINGIFTKADLKMLEHEFAESLIMRKQQVTWRAAHDIVNKYVNWDILVIKE